MGCYNYKYNFRAYENPEFDISERYGILLNVMFLTAFYSGIFP